MRRLPNSTVRSSLRRRWFPILALLAVAVASCGDDDSEVNGPTAPSPGAFAYVVQPDATVSIYTVEPGGSLTAINNPTVIPGPHSVALSPSADFVFVGSQPDVGNSDSAVSAYRIDPADGSIAAVAGGQTTRLPITALVVHPTGGFLYGTAPMVIGIDEPSGLYAFVVDATSGALRPVVGSPYPADLGNPTALAAHPSGRFLYVVYDSGIIDSHTINETNGTLGPIPSSPNAGDFPESIGIVPSGTFAYVASSDGAYAFSIDSQSGSLSALSGSPFTDGAGQSLAIHPSGNFVYVTNTSDEMVRGFTIDPGTGAMTAVSSAVAATGPRPVAITIDAAGDFAYVVNQAGRSISIYAIDAASGALTTMGSAQTRSDPFGIALRPPD